MCTRVTLKTPVGEVLRALEILGYQESEPEPKMEPRFNIAPTQGLFIIRRNGAQKLEYTLARWGLLPQWSPDMADKLGLYNARAETVDKKPAFRSAFQKRRCLIPVDGFYEWEKAGKKRLPHHFTLRSGGIFTLAGLWEGPTADSPQDSCTVLTTDANKLVAPLHDRMPVIVDRKDYEAWLNPNADAAELKKLLAPFPPEQMAEREVSTWVNNSRNEGPECLEAPKKENSLFDL
jgi:putative SOS response-associated peptidase YedK